MRCCKFLEVTEFKLTPLTWQESYNLKIIIKINPNKNVKNVSA